MNFTELLDLHKISYKENVSTSKISSIRAGGVAKIIIYPDNFEKMIYAVKACQAYFDKFKIIGGCTNTFFRDFGYCGGIICTKRLFDVKIDGLYVTASAGAPLSSILRFARDNEIELASELFGIPGTLGGAVRNNAGAFGKEISNVFTDGIFLNTDDCSLTSISSENLRFAYRQSLLQSENLILLSGRLKGKFLPRDEINEGFKKSVVKRRESQPSEASLGSFFKRTPGVIPAKLIDEAGLRGVSIGGAEVSQKHAGFIVNNGSATSSDIDNLASKIENVIFEKNGIRLAREAEYVI